jgi:DNA-3-methyladenine glycosylase II
MLLNPENIVMGCDHLAQADPRLEQLITQFGLPQISSGRDPYEALVRSIVSQQISWKAASKIFERFLALFPSAEFPDPQTLAAADLSQLRAAGLSQRKAEYVIGIGEAFSRRAFSAVDLQGLSDAEVASMLTAIRGVGQWTVDMLMLFTLGRADILPLSDLGIRKGIQSCFGLEGLPDRAQMEDLTRHWQPYRSLASWYMWKIVDDGFEWS